MDLDQAGSASPGRTEAFGDGVNGTPGSVASALDEQSAVFNSQVPGKFTPHSVLQSVMPSGNGKSAEDAQRTYPGGYTAPSPNGIDTSAAAMQMRLLGRNGI